MPKSLYFPLPRHRSVSDATFVARRLITKMTKLSHVMRRCLPGVHGLLRSLRQRRAFKRSLQGLHCAVATSLYPKGAIEVVTGPFRGARYINEIVWGPITPKWLGSYETELTSIIEEIVAGGPGKIIDVGCAEGYYAVGLATRLPDAIVHAYDVDFLARRQVRRLSRLNGVQERVVVHRECTHAELDRQVGDDGVIICDIEGHEKELLDPPRCKALLRCNILLELHEPDTGTGTEEIIISRFSSTHEIQIISQEDRAEWLERSGAELRHNLTPDLLWRAVQEYRAPAQRWLWMKARV